MTDNKLSTFADDILLMGLEKHHIVPIGNIDNVIKEVNQSEERRNKENVYNSPLNFVYITKESNDKILNCRLAEYASKVKTGSLSATGIKSGIHTNGNGEIHYYATCDDELRELLSKRFDELSNSVNTRIDNLIGSYYA